MTFDNDTCSARHMLLRGMLSATTYFCDAYASWQKGGVENANGRIRRWLPRGTDLDEISEPDIQEIAMTINLTPRKCLAYRSPVEAFLWSLARTSKSGLLDGVALCAGIPPGVPRLIYQLGRRPALAPGAGRRPRPDEHGGEPASPIRGPAGTAGTASPGCCASRSSRGSPATRTSMTPTGCAETR